MDEVLLNYSLQPLQQNVPRKTVLHNEKPWADLVLIDILLTI